MRIYRTKRVRREWTKTDRTLAALLFSANASNDEIAAALGRPPDAVRAWLHHYCKVSREPDAIEYPRAIVSHADVPQWYELGWRLAGFEDGSCVFEWRKEKCALYPPKKPSVDSGDNDAAFDRLTTLAVASLETEPA